MIATVAPQNWIVKSRVRCYWQRWHEWYKTGRLFWTKQSSTGCGYAFVAPKSIGDCHWWSKKGSQCDFCNLIHIIHFQRRNSRSQNHPHIHGLQPAPASFHSLLRCRFYAWEINSMPFWAAIRNLKIRMRHSRRLISIKIDKLSEFLANLTSMEKNTHYI